MEKLKEFANFILDKAKKLVQEMPGYIGQGKKDAQDFARHVGQSVPEYIRRAKKNAPGYIKQTIQNIPGHVKQAARRLWELPRSMT